MFENKLLTKLSNGNDVYLYPWQIIPGKKDNDGSSLAQKEATHAGFNLTVSLSNGDTKFFKGGKLTSLPNTFQSLFTNVTNVFISQF